MTAGPRRVTLLPLIAATYFMVAGGPYGLEDLVAKAGYRYALVALLVTPLIWSLPTALMVGELSGALPEEGGYYAWVKRALGPFWGFQEAWLSLVASVFDMAIYPTLFVLYLGRLVPALGGGAAATAIGLLMIAVCAAWNIRGARAASGAALVMSFALLAPFVAIVFFAAARGPALVAPSPAAPTLLGGILVAMWNYMGFDNASTIAGEVERPQWTYPVAMLATVGLVALTYMLPVLAVAHRGIDPSGWTTGAWVDAAAQLGGRWLGVAVVIGGMVCGVGMFNALVMSYSRLPMVLAEDGFLPRFVARRTANGAPWVAVLACAAAYAACLGLGFERLVELDVTLYGLSLALEFAALVVLRIREPGLRRPFRVPGGMAGAVLVGVLPMALLLVAVVDGREERAGTLSALTLSALLVAGGPVVYAVSVAARRERR